MAPVVLYVHRLADGTCTFRECIRMDEGTLGCSNVNQYWYLVR